MTIRISKPAFNLRDKLNELDGKVPLHKMPHGSIIQVKNLEYDTIFSSNHSGQQYVDVTNFNLDFAPKFKTSEILIELFSNPNRLFLLFNTKFLGNLAQHFA